MSEYDSAVDLGKLAEIGHVSVEFNLAFHIPKKYFM